MLRTHRHGGGTKGGWAQVGATLALLLLLPLGLAVCEAGTEPARLSLPVVADGAGLEVFTSSEGYELELSAFRVALRDLELTVGGEYHGALLKRLITPLAYAHPGHAAGGEITGELPGELIIDLASGADTPLGEATLLEGDYQGMNFTFRRAGADDGLTADDPLLGHTFALAGVARRDGRELAFEAALDIDDDSAMMIGAPFAFEAIEGAEATLVFRALMVDPTAVELTAFDDIDFFSLTDDEAIEITPGDEAHNILRRRLQLHDHWQLASRGCEEASCDS